MLRKSEKELKKWFYQKDRQPLILRGARQVGKTSLVRQFCLQEKIQLLEINLEYRALKSLENKSVQVDDIISEIELILKTKITSQSLIFFDEIQASPKLIQLLRYFYELKPQLAIIAAGSLLEFVLREGEFSFPVGRVAFHYLGPMTFTEFLLACGEPMLVEALGDPTRYSLAIHEMCINYLKKYFYLGGMPKVIARYIESNSMLEAREIQQQILQGYIADFPKYHRRIDLRRVEKVFQSSALSVGEKVIYQKLDQDSKSRDIKKVIELLIDAKVIIPAIHTEASGLPLIAAQDEAIFKYYFLDIGLLNCMHGITYDLLQDEFNSGFLTKGMLAEQFVAQHLCSIEGNSVPPRLNYWLRDKGSQKGEIDFLIQYRNTILPIEVKADTGGKLKSLFYFSHEKKLKKAVKISLAPLDKKKITHQISSEKVEVDLAEIPLFLTEYLHQYIEAVLW